jgi:hypothetical protein
MARMAQNISENTEDSKFSRPVGIILNCLLLTRFGDEKTASRESFKDEVDVYISSLMAAVKNPARAGHLKPYLMDPDVDLFRRLHKAGDARVRYIIYRTQDDVLIATVGLFENENPESYSKDPEYTNGKQGQMGRSETHFCFAFTYTHWVSDPSETIGSVLRELAVGFDKYVAILDYLHGEHYDLEKRLRGAEVYVLDRSAEESLRQLRIRLKQDEFLDAYLKWKETSRRRPDSEELKHRVELLAAELRGLDPSFTFDPT